MSLLVAKRMSTHCTPSGMAATWRSFPGCARLPLQVPKISTTHSPLGWVSTALCIAFPHPSGASSYFRAMAPSFLSTSFRLASRRSLCSVLTAPSRSTTPFSSIGVGSILPFSSCTAFSSRTPSAREPSPSTAGALTLGSLCRIYENSRSKVSGAWTPPA